ncbi:hypothetical protein Q9233_000904 [Columba guinea]|nr:hypothetical protein Q9233_000904 [Columba guinea]
MEPSPLAGFCNALSMGTWKRLSALVLGALRTHLAGRRKLLRVTDAVSESEAAQCGCSVSVPSLSTLATSVFKSLCPMPSS